MAPLSLISSEARPDTSTVVFNTPSDTPVRHSWPPSTSIFVGTNIIYISTTYATGSSGPITPQQPQPAYGISRHPRAPRAPRFPGPDSQALTRRYWAIGEARKLGQVEPEPKPLPSRLTRPARRAAWIVHRMRDPQRRGTSRTTRWASE